MTRGPRLWMVATLCLATLTNACGDDDFVPDVCGNGVRETGEECDGEDLGPATCDFFGMEGTLVCGDDCRLDPGTCVGCGNGLLEATRGEACDGEDLGGHTCVDAGFTGGAPGCSAGCEVDYTSCVGGCGNDLMEGDELCDGSDLGGLTCVSLGFELGALACHADCTLDASDCELEPRPLGAPCTGDEYCASGVCLTELSTGMPGGYCSGSCTDVGGTIECAEPDGECLCFNAGCAEPSCGQFCQPNVGGQCREAYRCMTISSGVGACRPACYEDAQCPATGRCDTDQQSPTYGLCIPPPEECTGGVDEDFDGLIDCADPDCNPTCPAGEVCDNGADDDGDGLVDCGDGECAFHTSCTGGACSVAVALPLDATLVAQANDQAGSTTTIDDWCGAGTHGWTGPEYVYDLTVTANLVVTVTVVGAATDLDLVVLRDDGLFGVCNPLACYAASMSTGSGAEEATFEANPGFTYAVVIDGWGGATGSYDLVISTAPGEVCDNGVDDDGDGLVDCGDPSCFGPPDCGVETACVDGYDNDQDGTPDCADSDCAGEPYCQASTVLFEGFTSWPPPGWSVEDGSQDNYTWAQCDGCGRTLPGADGPFAAVDSDAAGFYPVLNESLATGPLDLSAYGAVWLSFVHRFVQYGQPGLNDLAFVEVSQDATTWSPVAAYGADTSGTVLLDLSAELAGEATALVRFRYTDGGTWAWYWLLDSVELRAE